MKRLKPPFRGDHVGSLLRSKELVQARQDYTDGRISAADLRRVEQDEVRKVVKMQEDIGLQGVTDGEYTRNTWHMDFIYQIGGVTKRQENITVKFRNQDGTIEFKPSALRINGKLKLEKCIFGEYFAFLKSVTKATPKFTIPSPSMMHYRGGPAAIDPSVYPDMDQFWDDLAQVYANEIDELGRLGCTYLQIDDTSLAYLNDPGQRRYISEELGGDGEHQHLTYIRLINAAVAKRPADMTICVHMCRGNYRSSWAAAGGYDHVADALFNQLNVNGFFLEYDDARSGGFEPLRFVPKGDKQIVLGIVTTKRGELENKDDLKRRIDQAAKYVPLEQLCLSPQCGFASTAEGNALTVDEEVAKLRLVVETAREVWGS